MRKFLKDDSGQLILIACVAIAAALVMIATYGFYMEGRGENSINRENANSYFYYDSIRDNLILVGQNTNNAILKNDMKSFALLHGYSLDFVCTNHNTTIRFVDRDLQINEITNIGC